MTAHRETRAFRRDGAGHPIPGGSKIVDITNIPLTSASWKPVEIPSNKFCKQVVIGTRDQSNWRIAVSEAQGVAGVYKTMFGDMTMEIAGEAQEIFFYTQSVNATATLEVMLVD